MKIHCYYDPIPALPQFKYESALVELWKKSWERYGWEPIVLSLTDAEPHPYHDIIVESEWLAKSNNPRAYVRACYRRWMACARQPADDVVIHADYDVINYGFTPGAAIDVLENNMLVCWDKDRVPSLLGGLPALYDRMVRIFRNVAVMHYVTRSCITDDISDMNLFRDLSNEFTQVYSEIVYYRDYNWMSSPLVHFSNNVTGGGDRCKLIRSVRDPIIPDIPNEDQVTPPADT